MTEKKEQKSLININAIPIPEEITKDLIGPAVKQGGRLGGEVSEAFYHLVGSRLRKYNARKEKNHQDFLEKLNAKEPIPEEHIDEDKLIYAEKALDDMQFNLNQEKMREYAATLISRVADKRYNQDYKPIFSQTLADLTEEEMYLLSKIKNNLGSQVPMINIQIKGKNASRRKFTSDFYLYSDDFDLSGDKIVSYELLAMKKLIDYNFEASLTYEKYKSKYEEFKSSDICQRLKDSIELREDESFDFKEGYISLTEFGKSFCDFIL